MNDKKYELTDEVKTLADGTVLHRIRAVRNLILVNGTEVHAGDLGGWIEKECNLSQCGESWVGDDAQVFSEARVYEDANVCEEALVSGNAQVFGKSHIFNKAHVHGKACVSGNACIYGDACVYGESRVFGETEVYGEAEVYGKAWVSGNAHVYGEACVYGDACVYDEAQVSDKARVFNKAWIFGKSHICGDALVYGKAKIYGDAQVKSLYDYAIFKDSWSSGRWFTYTRSNKMWADGCFYGTGEELITKAYKDNPLSGRCYEAVVRLQETIEDVKTTTNKEETK